MAGPPSLWHPCLVESDINLYAVINRQADRMRATHSGSTACERSIRVKHAVLALAVLVPAVLGQLSVSSARAYARADTGT